MILNKQAAAEYVRAIRVRENRAERDKFWRLVALAIAAIAVTAYAIYLYI